MNYKIKKISGDASFREFYRVKKGKKTSILVFAKKEKFRNLILKGKGKWKEFDLNEL